MDAPAPDPDQDDPLRGARRKAAGRVLRLIIPAAILVALWFLVDGPDALRRLARADWRWLLAALVLAHLQIVLSALRWKLTAAQLDQSIRSGKAIAEYYLSQFLNHTLPSGVLGDAGRAVRMRHQAGIMRATQGVVIERMATQIALVAVMFAGFALSPLLPGGRDWPMWVSRIALTLGAGLGGLIVALLVMRHIPGVLARASRGFLEAARRALAGRRVWAVQWAAALLTVMCNLLIFAFCAAATGTSVPLYALVSVVPMILLAMLAPVSIGGWGLREGAAAALWPLMRAPSEAGIAASLAYGLVLLAASLPGALVIVFARRKG